MKTQLITLGIGLACLGTFRAIPAQAAESSDSAKAGVRFQQAVELYREGSYEGALAEFQKAYQISPSYRVLYNIAQTQYALHNFVGAYKSLMQYVAEGGSDIPADRRAQVDEMFAKLGERIAQLQISLNVDGADVRVDDVSVGVSPLPGLVPVNVGTRKISAFKSGSPQAVRVVTVAGKERVKIDLEIVQAPVATAPQISHPSSTAVPAHTIAKSQPQAPAARGRTGLIVSLSTTAALAVGTGVFGYMALKAKSDLDDELGKYPNTSDKIEDARSKAKQYAYLTDAFGAATLISGGVALYFALSQTDTPKAKPTKDLVLAPTLGGMVVSGRF